jgi:hypothetical protein
LSRQRFGNASAESQLFHSKNAFSEESLMTLPRSAVLLALILSSSSCTRPGSPVTESAKRRPAADLAALCRKGDLPSCREALDRLTTGEVPEDLQDLTARACQLGEMSGCALYFRIAEVRQVHFWDHRTEAISPAPDALIRYLRIDNLANRFQEIPEAVHPSPEFMSMLKGALAGIPENVAKLVNRNLIEIFLVKKLGSSAYSLRLLDEGAPTASSFIVLDIGKLTQKANAWAAWKENTPFRAEPGLSIDVKIEQESDDSVQNALQYVLLHEMGHVVDNAIKILPPEDSPVSPVLLQGHPFLALSWVIEGERFKSRFDSVFPERGRIRYYADRAEDKLPISHAPEIYQKLQTTSFASLYGSTNPQDDFAEAFASYVHTVLMRKPNQVSVKKDGRVIQTLNPCWEAPRCAEKRLFLEKVLSGS